MRRAAVRSNASIARQVAEKRANIASTKRTAQDLVRQLQESLREARQELARLKSEQRAAAKRTSTAVRTAASSLDLLRDLQSAHEAGLLSDTEYEEKRRKLVSQI